MRCKFAAALVAAMVFIAAPIIPAPVTTSYCGRLWIRGADWRSPEYEIFGVGFRISDVGPASALPLCR
ncbi:hypothetical protein E6H12_05795 [Candidatus Bathyarchaeota archaeon]|nr:MAG: hypothetical protein E6H12_05795 [Candidatus Bathyarchaeota archaeon]